MSRFQFDSQAKPTVTASAQTSGLWMSGYCASCGTMGNGPWGNPAAVLGFPMASMAQIYQLAFEQAVRTTLASRPGISFDSSLN